MGHVASLLSCGVQHWLLLQLHFRGRSVKVQLQLLGGQGGFVKHFFVKDEVGFHWCVLAATPQTL
jgi:hypothetical protein